MWRVIRLSLCKLFKEPSDFRLRFGIQSYIWSTPRVRLGETFKMAAVIIAAKNVSCMRSMFSICSKGSQYIHTIIEAHWHNIYCTFLPVMKDAMKKLLYADYTGPAWWRMANRSYRQETMGEWNVLFTKPREYGSAAHRPPEGRAGHRAGGEETDSTGQFRVQEGQCAETGRRREVRRRVQAGPNARREVEGVMADRRISKRLKGKAWRLASHQHACTERKPWLWPNYTTTKAASVRKQLGPKK